MGIKIRTSFISSRYIKSLAWYHNGTQVTSSSRIFIYNNGADLVILSMVESDAGKYEVKIHSMEYNRIHSLICDKNILPMMENMAIFAPVTFILQKASLPSYMPEEEITEFILPSYHGTSTQTIAIDNVIDVNLNAVQVTSFRTSILLKDGTKLHNGDMYNITVLHGNVINQSVRISYNNTDGIAGNYIYAEYLNYWEIKADICPHYLTILRFQIIPMFILHWIVSKLNDTLLHFDLMCTMISDHTSS